MVTTGQVRELADQLLGDALVILPVRHHSPACALQVERAVEERRPSVVLVEGPRGFDPLIPLLTHPEAAMPLAVYTYVVRRGGKAGTEERAAAYYPFCDYSPELVALQAAAAMGVPARFIDLDFAEQQVGRDENGDNPRAGRSLLDERHYRHSRSLELLARRLGCRDDEDLWERLFESQEQTLSEHVAGMAAYCRLARNDHTDDDLRIDGTTAREAEMARHIRAALADRRPGDGPVLVVVGGFHAVALRELVNRADEPVSDGAAANKLTTESALIRYTFERLERLNGYASGMTSPAWHQRLWDQRRADAAGDARAAATLAALLDIAQELRKRHRMPVPVPSVVAAYSQALQLAGLRGRPAPLRSDLLDGITSCFVKGEVGVEGVRVRAAARVVLTGDRVGVVPPGAGTPPLVADTLTRLRRQRLKVDQDQPATASLDIYRRPEHRETSRLLHGLVLLGVPFANRTAGPDFVHGHGLARLQERWDYHWSPVSEGALVEVSLYGATLPEAVTAKFGEVLAEQAASADARSAAATVALLSQACLLGLHDHLDETLELVQSSLGSDESFSGVARATSALGLLSESREPLEARRLDVLPDLLLAAYQRWIFLGRELQGQECPGEQVAEALMQVRELLASAAGSGLDESLYWLVVDRLRGDHDLALVRGAATGIGYSAGRIDQQDLAVAVSGHLSGTVGPDDAVGFLCGLLLTAREAAWQDDHLLAGLDSRLAAWDDRTFLQHLPELRLAFASMTPLETDRIAEAVARLHGVETLGPLHSRDLAESDIHHHLAASATVTDLVRADGLGHWLAGGAAG